MWQVLHSLLPHLPTRLMASYKSSPPSQAPFLCSSLPHYTFYAWHTSFPSMDWKGASLTLSPSLVSSFASLERHNAPWLYSSEDHFLLLLSPSSYLTHK